MLSKIMLGAHLEWQPFSVQTQIRNKVIMVFTCFGERDGGAVSGLGERV
jgi:hypothetical protein